MITRAMEFLRISDTQPTDGKVRIRTDSSADLMTQISSRANQRLLLSCIQGVVSGFDKAPFNHQSPAVIAIIKVIKDRDSTLPADLTENALELKAVAAIALGELLSKKGDAEEREARLLTALALRSALSIKPATTQKHLRYIFEVLLPLADKILLGRGNSRRIATSDALLALKPSSLAFLKEYPEVTTKLFELVPSFAPFALKTGGGQAEQTLARWLLDNPDHHSFRAVRRAILAALGPLCDEQLIYALLKDTPIEEVADTLMWIYQGEQSFEGKAIQNVVAEQISRVYPEQVRKWADRTTRWSDGIAEIVAATYPLTRQGFELLLNERVFRSEQKAEILLPMLQAQLSGGCPFGSRISFRMTLESSKLCF